MEIFFNVHRDLPREAPGSDACTARALATVPRLPDHPSILDIGCGPGAQTLALAQATNGLITATDIHQPYLDVLTQKAQAEGFSDRITTRNASMMALDFDDASFDLIWSEGAIYIIGFREGLDAWRRLLKPGGALAVTEVSWLAEDPPYEPWLFWEAAYPAIQSIEQNIAVIQEAGYRFVDHFVLPESAWWDAYYTPMEQRIAALRLQNWNNTKVLALLDEEQREIDLYRQYAYSYGYVFYIMVHDA